MVDMDARQLSLSSLIAPVTRTSAAEHVLSHVDVLHGGWPAAEEALAQYSTLDPAQRLAIKVCCLLLCCLSDSTFAGGKSSMHLLLALPFLTAI